MKLRQFFSKIPKTMSLKPSQAEVDLVFAVFCKISHTFFMNNMPVTL